MDRGRTASKRAWTAAVLIVWALSVASSDINFTAAVRGLHVAVVIGGVVEQLLSRSLAPLLTSAVVVLAATLANDQIVSSSLFPLVLMASMG